MQGSRRGYRTLFAPGSGRRSFCRPDARSFRKILRILPASPVYNRFLPSGDHEGYSSTPSAKVTCESVVCKAGPELLHRVTIMKTSAMTATAHTTAGTTQGDRLV